MSLVAVAGLVAVVALLAWRRWFHSAAPARPPLSAPVTRERVTTQDGERTYDVFVPAKLASRPALVLVLHGSSGDAGQIRRYTGYEFERLADEQGFIVAYPNGYRGYWNDVRVKGGYAAKRRNVDDVAFLCGIIDRFRASHGVASSFVAGYSNGGYMSLRMAFDAPDHTSGIAMFSASVPTDDNCVSPLPTRAVRALFVSGTKDPITPYEGGRVSIFGFGDRGSVRNASDSLAFLARLLGADATHAGPDVVVPARADSPTWVERRAVASPAGEVVLFTVHGGGHVVHQPRYRFPRFVGATEMRFNAPEACWRFFSGAPGSRAT